MPHTPPSPPLLEVLSAHRDSHDAAQGPGLPARQPPGLRSDLALPTLGWMVVIFSLPGLLSFWGKLMCPRRRSAIRSSGMGRVGSWLPVLKKKKKRPSLSYQFFKLLVEGGQTAYAGFQFLL